MATALNVRVTIDEKGNATIEFDREKLMRLPMDTVVREVAATAQRVREAIEQAGEQAIEVPAM